METETKKRPDYSDSRRTNGGRGRVEIAVWENGTEKGLQFGTQLKFQYRPKNGEWKELNNPMADQWLDVAKLLQDADSWKQQRLQERRSDQANSKSRSDDVEEEMEFEL